MDSGLGSKFGQDDEELDMSSPGLLDESLETKPIPNDTLYSILNVPKTAPAAEIRERYRELAVLLHPDKAPPEHRQAAETQFRNLQRAFEVLLDPEKRAVYDALGEEGLKSEWRVGLKGKSPEQLRDDYATFVAKRSEALADRVFMPVSNTFTCEVDTSGTFRRSPYQRARGTSAEVRRLALGSKYKTQLTNSTSATLSATLFQVTADGKARLGRGLSGAIRHQFSPGLYFAASSSLLGARVVNLKAGYTVDSYTEAEVEGTSPLILFAPTFKVSVNRRLHLNAVGSLSYFSGSTILQSPSSFSVSYARSASAPPSRTPLIASETHSHETTLELAGNGGSVSTGYTIPLTRALTMQTGASKPLLTGELNLFLKADLRLARGLVFTCATFIGTGGLHLHLG
ncbi:hypothetical protein M407DRAFT_17434 [Tulasnella calospora MUT 4182]|uniref:J domain-containing protein n=1 Tax=Tulasnella calospora MUT 4182 TaxID=1051891 RepID=A0A0C3LIQ1_9AGAM|nr:hypothetical protein M407DRAFT_17434 [Tulasnella calospora MUT 4182]